MGVGLKWLVLKYNPVKIICLRKGLFGNCRMALFHASSCLANLLVVDVVHMLVSSKIKSKDCVLR